jgi:hypothetical protein
MSSEDGTDLFVHRYYTDFLAFFQKEIDKMGWQKVLNEYLFKGDERSEDMLIRMFAGKSLVTTC